MHLVHATYTDIEYAVICIDMGHCTCKTTADGDHLKPFCVTALFAQGRRIAVRVIYMWQHWHK